MKYITRWWNWSTEGGKVRKAIGLGVPAIVVLFILSVALGSNDQEEGGQGSEQQAASTQTESNLDIRPTQARDTSTMPEAPTDTPEPPTPAPEPSATPEPTVTPEPTPAPDPIVLEGTGDDVIEIEPGPGILYVTGNSGSAHFAIWGYDATGGRTELFVNTTDPYEGQVPLDFRAGQETTRLEVTATGPWTVEVRPLNSARAIDVPSSVDGIGDEVLLVSGKPDTAVISGNAVASHFAVWAWGSRADLLVNTTDPYEGKVIVPSDTIVLTITAVGPWTISLD